MGWSQDEKWWRDSRDLTVPVHPSTACATRLHGILHTRSMHSLALSDLDLPVAWLYATSRRRVRRERRERRERDTVTWYEEATSHVCRVYLSGHANSLLEGLGASCADHELLFAVVKHHISRLRGVGGLRIGFV